MDRARSRRGVAEALLSRLRKFILIGFAPTPYRLEHCDGPVYFDKPQDEDEGDDSDDDHGGGPVYDKYEHNEAAEGEQRFILSTIIIKKSLFF